DYDVHRQHCDITLWGELEHVCALATESPDVIRACEYFAFKYGTGISDVGGIGYGPDQRAVCKCCPSGSSDGTASGTGSTITDDLFGTRAQVSAPAGVFPVSTAVSIDVLPAS